MKPGTVRDLGHMLSGMYPQLSEQVWCFQAVEADSSIPQTAFAIIHEAEGTSCILPAQEGAANAVQFARITLLVNSDLEGVGLTAAVSNALATSGIACNIIAGLHHDHLFVPWAMADEALALLQKLSVDARR